MNVDFSNEEFLVDIEKFHSKLISIASPLWQNGYSEENRCFDLCHDNKHLIEVVNAANMLAYNAFNDKQNEMSTDDYVSLIIASFFHDVGRKYSDKYHEIVSSGILFTYKEMIRMHFKSLTNHCNFTKNYDEIFEIAFKAILEHRSSKRATTNVSSYLKDCDDIALTDKYRATYRVCMYALSHPNEFDHSANELIKNRRMQANLLFANAGCVSELGKIYIEPYLNKDFADCAYVCTVLSDAKKDYLISNKYGPSMMVNTLSIKDFVLPWEKEEY